MKEDAVQNTPTMRCNMRRCELQAVSHACASFLSDPLVLILNAITQLILSGTASSAGNLQPLQSCAHFTELHVASVAVCVLQPRRTAACACPPGVFLQFYGPCHLPGTATHDFRSYLSKSEALVAAGADANNPDVSTAPPGTCNSYST